MDPISIGLAALALFSAVMSVGQAIETYTLWQVKKAIPTLIREGTINMLRDPELIKQIFSQEVFDALATSLWENFKHHIGKQLEGQIGKQGAAEKAMERDFVSEIAPFVDLLPDKWRERVQSNPRLLPFLLDLAQRFGPMLMQSQNGGR